MNHTHDVEVSATIHASPKDIWQAFVDPELFKQWMYGSTVTSDWKKGSTITYSGEWEGKPYEDKGTIEEIIPEKFLKTTYFSPASGQKDAPENYQTVSYEIQEQKDGSCTVVIRQENNESQEAADRVRKNWEWSLQSIKKLVEK